MRNAMVEVPLPPHLHDADDDAVRALLCAIVDRGLPADALWFRCADHFLVAAVGPREAAQDTWNAAVLRLSDHPGLRGRYRVGAVADADGRAACVLQWSADAWTAACRPLGPDGRPAGAWAVTRGRGYDALRPGLLVWVDAGSRGVERLDQLTAHTRLRPPIRRDAFDLPFDPARNVRRLAEQLGAFYDVVVARQGLPFRIVSLVRGRQCVVYEIDLHVEVPLDDFVRTVAARETCVAAAVLSPERTIGPEGAVVHEARLLVESAGRRAERRARIVPDPTGRVAALAAVTELGKVRGTGWMGVAPRSVIELTALGDTPGSGDD